MLSSYRLKAKKTSLKAIPTRLKKNKPKTDNIAKWQPAQLLKSTRPNSQIKVPLANENPSSLQHHTMRTRMWASRNVTTTVKNLLMFMTRAVWLNVSLDVVPFPTFVINGHKDVCSDSQGAVTRAYQHRFLPPHQLQKKSITAGTTGIPTLRCFENFPRN